MNSTRTFAATVAAVVVLLALTDAALAATAIARSSVNVRSGPGTGYRIVDRLHAGERVNVDRCTRGYAWCHVQHPGPDGWVSAAYLSDTRQRPLNRFGFYLNIPQLGFSIGIGPGGSFVGPGPQQVCFYEHINYQGARFCVRPGQANARLGPSWNDRISSIRVQGGARVRVCEHWDFAGRCTVVTSNRSSLGANNDIISSYRAD